MKKSGSINEASFKTGDVKTKIFNSSSVDGLHSQIDAWLIAYPSYTLLQSPFEFINSRGDFENQKSLIFDGAAALFNDMYTLLQDTINTNNLKVTTLSIFYQGGFWYYVVIGNNVNGDGTSAANSFFAIVTFSAQSN